MTLRSSPSVPASRLIRTTVLAIAASVLCSAAATADDAAGTWQSHKYSFQYMGFTSTYSCDGLADKLKTLLLAAGARADVKSQPGACASGFGRPDKFARADLTFYTLTPLDANAAGNGTSAPGLWRPVVLSDRAPRDLRVGDCELVEQFRNLVLPMFSTRNVVNNTTCVPHQESGSIIDLKFDAFAALPPVKGSAGTHGGG